MNGPRPRLAAIRFWQGLLVGLCVVGLGLGALAVARPDLGVAMHARLGGESLLKTSYQQTRTLMLGRQDWMVPDGSILMFGDSLTAGLATDAVRGDVLNFGIGGDTISGVMIRLRGLDSPQRARHLVLAIGTNDLAARTPVQDLKVAYEDLLASLPPNVPVSACAILPVGRQAAHSSVRPEMARSFNGWLKSKADASDTLSFCPVPPAFVTADGYLPDWAHTGDGVHLSKRGYGTWVVTLREHLDGV